MSDTPERKSRFPISTAIYAGILILGCAASFWLGRAFAPSPEPAPAGPGASRENRPTIHYCSMHPEINNMIDL